MFKSIKTFNYLYYTLIGLFVLAVVALRYVIIYQANLPLLPDEAQYWGWSKHLDWGYYSKPPMIAYLIHISTNIFGDTTFGVRAMSNFLHFMTAIMIYFCCLEVAKKQIVALVSSTIYLTLPAVSFSALIISTDVPLLFCWAGAFLFWLKWQNTNKNYHLLFIAFFISLGLLAKYAMIYFPLCISLYAIFDKDTRKALKNKYTLYALLIILVGFLPNLIWNINHHFITFKHTVDNANIDGSNHFNIFNLVEFLLSQVAMIGPILLSFYVIIFFSYKLNKNAVFFSAPIFALMSLESLFSRANANWAAPAYIAIVITLSIYLFLHYRRLFYVNLLLNVMAMVFLYYTIEFSPIYNKMKLYGLASSYIKETIINKNNNYPILADERKMTASLFYAFNNTGKEIYAWKNDWLPPANYFEMNYQFDPLKTDKIYYVTKLKNRYILYSYQYVNLIERLELPSNLHKKDTFYIYELSGYKYKTL